MAGKDYYKLLGLDRDADADAIKKAFRRLARQYHPDVNKSDKHAEERFKEINAAYETLSDPAKRKLYDQLGANYERLQQGGGGGAADWSEMFRQAQGSSGANFDPASIFETLFGSASGAGPRTARNVEQEVELTLADAYHGTSRIVRRGAQEIEVAIPPGVRTGSRVRVRGQGARSARSQTGDLYLVVNVLPDPVYERKDDDLYRSQNVDAFTAMLGGEVTAETLGGSLAVRIPAGTSSGKLVRLRGKGMPRLQSQGESGDLYLRVQITVPQSLSEEDRRTLEKMARRYTS